MADKLIGRGKFDDFAWLIRIGVYYIVIADEQMTIGREYHCQRPVQVNVILVDDRPRTLRLVEPCGVGNRKDLIVY